MNGTRMLMVTSLYPYGQGETFVVAELEHVSPCFSRVDVVPSFYDPDTSPRPESNPIDLAYADKRWGPLRAPRMVGALLMALLKYRWVNDFGYVLARGRRLANLKELVRALYRARMFERFLADKARRAGPDGIHDVIYFYWLVPEIVGAVQFRKASGAPVRIVCRAHRGDLYEDLKPGGYAGLRREIIAGIDEVYCISDHGSRYLHRRFPESAVKFRTARLGVDDPGYLNRQPQDGPLAIVSCSFVIASKRLHLIVGAIARLLEDHPALQVRWTHIGDGPLLDAVKAQAARLGERAQVVFKGYQTQAEVMALYRDERFDLIINVSDSEGIPVSLMEACAAGIPIVATNVGGSAEIVSTANGVLLDADADAATIATAMLRFNDRIAARACRRAARQFWDARFNAATNYARFGRQLAGRDGSRAGTPCTLVALETPHDRDPAAG